MSKSKYIRYRIDKQLDKSKLPSPVFEAIPEFIELYWKAWELAWEHVLYREDSPQKFYIDEAMTPDTIWIWDTLFMSLFCKYGYTEFPGIESLNNFYFILHDNKNHPARVQHPDNPPLFAWVEYEYAKLTGDLMRLKWVLEENQYLQKHFEFIEKAHRFKFIPGCNIPMMVKMTKYGYVWSGTSSGMDNTPRGRGKYWKILWVDLIAQQALSAYYISLIASCLHNSHLQSIFLQRYIEIKKLINRYYWDEQDTLYYDLNRYCPQNQIKVITPASFWPMLAEVPSREQSIKMVQHIKNPETLGGFLPWPTVARNDKNFDEKGQYWRGSVWVPTSYMATKALEKYGFFEVARTTSEQLLKVMYQTFHDFTPHTIWEAYCPIAPKPATYKRNARYVRPEFCGWSALAPISLFIENLLGFYSIDALRNEIHWNLHKDYSGKLGIQNLHFGNIYTDILYEENQFRVKSNLPYSLIVNKSEILEIKPGQNNFNLKNWKPLKIKSQ
ncbi:MAG: alpha,alpha-trehalase [Candidatus Lokiarchaeota archaeon]|nr:alpha,alpha-trehalase [Candidatus Lokiarchaeota archaeon]